ncbi:thermosome subunit beta [Conexivisphaera calida]|uniref:Heat shock protein 60 family chaperone GroEL, Thermosome subunit n=1 Tax=Conexivisphaera calida TaxID=1874277 RepID=A0A4P2VDY0_9ARCH|nr:thermosome subunit beta [Conexivisphaera calida]BBE42836.1 Heat shock protein 60 family chaperone GroEL, Thermosome subunit [Conexivisphaera calida]
MPQVAIPAMTSTGQPVLILKEGSSETKGREALRNNIEVAKIITDLVRTSLGPRGMDKMLVDSLGDVTITNDGATILKELDVQHPTAKLLVEIAKATDAEVGDGTTTSVVLSGELISGAQELIEKGVHPTVVVDGYRKASKRAMEILNGIAIKVSPTDREWLRKVALTAMASKVVSSVAPKLADIAIDAVLQVAEKRDGGYKVDIDSIKVEKKPGGAITDTLFVKGIVIDKEVVHGGMPKKVENAKIALINAPLEIEKPEFDTKINVTDPAQMKAFLDEEARILREMVQKIKATGANVVFCQKGIDDLAQHYLAKEGILAVRRVKMSDMEKLAKATGGRVVTTLDDLTPNDLGYAALVEERKIEEDKWVFVEGCKDPKAVTILVRGGSQRIVDEAERSIHDALMVVKDVVESPAVVGGGGAPEAETAYQLRQWAQTLSGREQLAVLAYANALERIPLTLAENAGMNPLDAKTELAKAHSEGRRWAGVDPFESKVVDMDAKNVYEPLSVKLQVVKAATEAASMVLRIDDIIAASKVKEEEKKKGKEEEGEEGSSSMPNFG